MLRRKSASLPITSKAEMEEFAGDQFLYRLKTRVVNIMSLGAPGRARSCVFPSKRQQRTSWRAGRKSRFGSGYFAGTIGICDASWSWIIKSTR